jgi:hypothetical protein
MIKFVKIILPALAIVAFSCQSRKEDDLDIGKTVMKEIFPSLLDSMYVEILFSFQPPPAKEVFDSASGNTVLRLFEKTEILKDQFRKELTEHKKGLLITTIVLNDSIHPVAKDERLEYQSRRKLSGVGFTQGYKIGPDIPIQTTGFKIVLSSSYKPKPGSFDRVLKVLSFSRIIFDKGPNEGMLTAEYICGELCGNGYRIYIRKEHDKWIINSIEHVWVE